MTTHKTNHQIRVSKPFHRGDAEYTENSQRKEEERFPIDFLLFLSPLTLSQFLLSSLRILCVLCVSAVKGHYTERNCDCHGMRANYAQ